MIELLIIIFSLLIGSFYNVCIHRISSGESVVYPPSHCPNCQTPLKVLDLIPIFSYIFLLGKCRYCDARISIQYPIVEFITSILGLLLYKTYGLSFQFAGYYIFIGLLIIITFIDINHQIIPNSLVLFGVILGMLLSLTSITTGILDSLLGLFVGSGSLLMVALIGMMILGKEAMGGGDIKLMGFIGVFLGWRLTLLALLFSVYIGGVFSIILLLAKIKKRGDYIPFGPFIVLGSITSLFWGEGLLSWYIINFL